MFPRQVDLSFHPPADIAAPNLTEIPLCTNQIKLTRAPKPLFRTLKILERYGLLRLIDESLR
jgi:hypothetical protein